VLEEVLGVDAGGDGGAGWRYLRLCCVEVPVEELLAKEVLGGGAGRGAATRRHQHQRSLISLWQSHPLLSETTSMWGKINF
jgi:hypothetical protein